MVSLAGPDSQLAQPAVACHRELSTEPAKIKPGAAFRGHVALWEACSSQQLSHRQSASSLHFAGDLVEAALEGVSGSLPGQEHGQGGELKP